MKTRRAKCPVGARYGLWVVVGLAPRAYSREPIRWLCRCDCGTEKAVNAYNLKHGESKSCGEECPLEVTDGRKRKKHKDLTGSRVGRWVVLKQLPKKDNGKYVYLCRCECGTEKEVIAGHLMSGRTQSCGCLRIEAVSKRPFESLYNRLVTHNTGVSVNLSYEEYLEFTKITICHYCQDAVEWQSSGRKSTAYKIDRKDNTLGYSKENCVVCCGSCNRTKGDRFTYEEFMLLVPMLRQIREARKVKA